MNQDVLNKMWVAIAKLQSDVAGTLYDAAKKMEDSGDPEKFRKAQEAKVYGNLLEAESSKMRADYPHLFRKPT